MRDYGLSSLPRNYAVYIAEMLDTFLQADDEAADLPAAPVRALAEEDGEMTGFDDLADQEGLPRRSLRG